MSQKEDLRVRRTQKMLRQAFVELVVAEGFEAITIQMLADHAMINRATFYRHFEGKFELAMSVYEELISEYVASVYELESNDPAVAWCLLFTHTSSYGDFYLAMLSSMPTFRERLTERVEQEMYMRMSRMGLDEAKVAVPLPLLLRYLASAQIGVLVWWLKEKQPIPPAEMAEYLLQLDLQGGFQPLHLLAGFSGDSK